MLDETWKLVLFEYVCVARSVSKHADSSRLRNTTFVCKIYIIYMCSTDRCSSRVRDKCNLQTSSCNCPSLPLLFLASPTTPSFKPVSWSSRKHRFTEQTR